MNVSMHVIPLAVMQHATPANRPRPGCLTDITGGADGEPVPMFTGPGICARTQQWVEPSPCA